MQNEMAIIQGARDALFQSGYDFETAFKGVFESEEHGDIKYKSAALINEYKKALAVNGCTVNLADGIFQVRLNNGFLTCYLSRDKRGRVKREISESKCGYNWGRCAALNQWAVSGAVFGWDGVRKILFDTAADAGILITR